MPNNSVPKARKTTYEAMLDYLRNSDGKVSDGALATARLASYCSEEITLSKVEKRKWQRLGVMDAKGRVKMEKPENGLEWALTSAVWDGLLQRVPVKSKQSKESR